MRSGCSELETTLPQKQTKIQSSSRVNSASLAFKLDLMLVAVENVLSTVFNKAYKCTYNFKSWR